MYLLQLLGDLSHLASIFILMHKIQTTQSCRGISFKTQALYLAAFLTRYLDLFFSFVSLYNTVMKLFFIYSSCFILYLMKFKYRSTYDPSIDTFEIEFILAPSLILALIFNYKFNVAEIMWSFSIWLGTLAILPQLFMFQRTGEAETLTTPYLAALGLHRALYISYWIQRYHITGIIDPIAVTAGIVQAGLYIGFFYIYFTA